MSKVNRVGPRPAPELAGQLRSDAGTNGSTMMVRQALEEIGRILDSHPARRILIFAELDQNASVRQVTARGTPGYLTKQVSSRILTRAVADIYNGDNVFRDGIHRHLPVSPALRNRSAVPAKKIRPLSPRETEVLQHIAEGRANKQTAAELGLSIKTIEKHRQHLMKKLDIHETASLTRYAISSGLIQCDPLPDAEPVAKPGNLLVLKLSRKKCRPPMLASGATDGLVVRHNAAKRLLATCGAAAR